MATKILVKVEAYIQFENEDDELDLKEIKEDIKNTLDHENLSYGTASTIEITELKGKTFKKTIELVDDVNW